MAGIHRLTLIDTKIIIFQRWRKIQDRARRLRLMMKLTTRLRRYPFKQPYLNLNSQTGFQKAKTAINASQLSIWKLMRQMLIFRPMVNIPLTSPQLVWIATRWSRALWVPSSTKATSSTWNSFNYQRIRLKTRCKCWNIVSFLTLSRSHRSPLRYQHSSSHLQAFWPPIDVPRKRGLMSNLSWKKTIWRSKMNLKTMMLRMGSLISGKSKTKWPYSRENSNNPKSFLMTGKSPPFFIYNIIMKMLGKVWLARYPELVRKRR